MMEDFFEDRFMNIKTPQNAIKLSEVSANYHPNLPIDLYSGPIHLEVEDGSELIEGEGVAFIKWLPKPVVELILRSESERSLDLLGKPYAKAVLPDLGCKADVVLMTTSFSEDAKVLCHLNGCLNQQISKSLKRVQFHLTNFHHYKGAKTPTDHSFKWDSLENGLILNGGGWKVTINRTDHLDRLEKRLKDEGGYAITHIGMIERKNEELFSVAEVEAFFEILVYFFGFVRGFWSSPNLMSGFDEFDNLIWAEWALHRLDNWRTVSTWFDENNTEMLVELFPGFVKCFQDETWTDAIQTSIYWYVAANSQAGGIEGSIVLIQAALELLAWVSLVQTGPKLKMLLDKNNSVASDQIRLLLFQYGIPIEIPSELENLLGYINLPTNKVTWVDGPHAFTEVRNGIAHATKKRTMRLDSSILL